MVKKQIINKFGYFQCKFLNIWPRRFIMSKYEDELASGINFCDDCL